jgi:predicted nuclease of predicted toxin-antitoxin system
MRLFLDENLSPQLITRLSAFGHDAVCAYDAGLCGKSDAKIREFAIQQSRVLVTLDGDFADLTRYPVMGTPGIIWLRPVPPVTLVAIEHQLMKALEVLQNRNIRELLVIVGNGRIRSRAGI